VLNILQYHTHTHTHNQDSVILYSRNSYKDVKYVVCGDDSDDRLGVGELEGLAPDGSVAFTAGCPKRQCDRELFTPVGVE